MNLLLILAVGHLCMAVLRLPCKLSAGISIQSGDTDIYKIKDGSNYHFRFSIEMNLAHSGMLLVLWLSSERNFLKLFWHGEGSDFPILYRLEWSSLKLMLPPVWYMCCIVCDLLVGFLAQMVQGGALEDCVRSANYAANYIIQQSGCQLPDKPNFSRDSVGFWVIYPTCYALFTILLPQENV